MTAPSDAVTSETIAQCERLIRPFIRRTPVVEVDCADFGLPRHPLTIKLELLQHSGSFKARGAFSNLLTRDVPKAGVVAASGGNHGAAVAYAAMKLCKPAKIFVPSISSPAKVQRIRDYGADLAIEGDRYSDALAASEAWAQQTGALPVPAFDQNETILGQGTVGLELADQAPEIDTLLVSVGGGGLIAGIAAWYTGRIKVIGVEPLASPTLTKALEAGHPVDAEAGGLAADSLAPRRVGEKVFPIVRKYAPQTVLVSDAAIAEAQATLWRALRIVAEPGGAAAFSAILSGAYKPSSGERVAVIVSGGNTAAVEFDRLR
ncbi:threonine dehydratase [Bradyrhizobium sp. CCBAU 051011]|uniref:threonine/serine dehydratase n=1 Tax=Bradyrhizobium sp. CCBAU 051011 TaxID=858422 RepID=UPI0013743E3F|nr:threonine/serine dehydratase [Bradyrhizobium sp. CCBAU 051011]QHO73965.1 threonine dehydratase [Bradyrhizobium sp. CCBAU 051011]